MKQWLQRFWTQPNRQYRNFQIVFTALTLNFAIPSLCYVVAPEASIGQFIQLNQLAGGAEYTFPESASRLWRYLGTANVATLALMCALLQMNLRKNLAVLLPLTFMKGMAATFFLCAFLATPQYRVFLVAGIFDLFTTAAFQIFAKRAFKQIQHELDESLVPQPIR